MSGNLESGELVAAQRTQLDAGHVDADVVMAVRKRFLEGEGLGPDG